MFVDKAVVTVSAGDGGEGKVSFRHEKYIDRGGPDGGDGGRGASIYIQPDPNLSTLMDFRFRKKYQAPNGDPGMGKNRAAKRRPESC